MLGFGRALSVMVILAVTSTSLAQSNAPANVPANAPATVSSGATSKSQSSTTTLKSEGAPRARKALRTKVKAKSGISAPTFGDFTMIGQLKNTATFGRKYELETVGGRNYQLTNELVLGMKHASGWSLKATAAVRQTSNNDTSKDKRFARDSAIIVGHPALYRGPVFSLGGELRQFIPTSNASKAAGATRTGYAAFADWKLPAKFALSNFFYPNVFGQDEMKATDSDFYIYNGTELVHQTTQSIAFALGAQSQFEHHKGTPSGTTVELYPMMNLEFIPNLLIQPKVYLPVFVQDVVGGAPSVVAISQLQAELYIKMGF